MVCAPNNPWPIVTGHPFYLTHTQHKHLRITRGNFQSAMNYWTGWKDCPNFKLLVDSPVLVTRFVCCRAKVASVLRDPGRRQVVAYSNWIYTTPSSPIRG
ncbi:hypothetical protein F4782DRAFT_291250 [Xylaria castorea]|nr:hypothetical protein F4782DRAFT_291250 [Xylaria castorea]